MKLFIGGIQALGNAQRAARRDLLPERLGPHAFGKIYGYMALAASKNLWHPQCFCSLHCPQDEFGTPALHKYKEFLARIMHGLQSSGSA